MESREEREERREAELKAALEVVIEDAEWYLGHVLGRASEMSFYGVISQDYQELMGVAASVRLYCEFRLNTLQRERSEAVQDDDAD
jgi:hypothetical protein